MGEVYRARDTRLERSVAIKVLPAAFAGNAALRLRLDREAKAISSLSHPHICSLFDVGSHDGTDYLVMELLEGESLAERLERGPLPMPDVFRLGAQIADALAAAHRAGIVHRDLKPGNVMLTKSGAKLLDFGLAKSGVQAPAAVQTDMATEQRPITEEGAIVGTFQYMAPEQLEGLAADARTDVFALGTMLYEMATGTRAFSGKTRTSLIAAIVNGQPRPIVELQPVTPLSFERLVRACMEKDPDDRLQSAHDVAVQLRWIAAGDGAVSSRRASRLPWALAGLLALALAGGAVYHLRSRPAPPRPMRFTIESPPEMNAFRTAAISPDGKRIVFRADTVDRRSSLWLRSLDSATLTQLPGTEAPQHVFWSPDGREIAFSARGALWRMGPGEGNLRKLVDGIAPIAGGGTWSRDGVIVYSALSDGPLRRVSADGGESKEVTRFRAGEGLHLWPWFLPDGQRFLFTVLGSADVAGIYVGSLDENLHKRVVPFGAVPDMSRAIYARGRLYYIRGRSLVAQEFSPGRLEVRGNPVIVDEDVEFTGPVRTPLSVSDDGTLVYRKAGAVAVEQLVLCDRSGRELGNVGKPGPYNVVRFSPDGTRVLMAYDDPVASTWIHDLERGTETKMTSEIWAGIAAWVDNESFVYSAVSNNPPNLFLKNADGTVVRVTESRRQAYVTSVSPDRRYAIATIEQPGSSEDIFAIPLAPPHTPVPLIVSASGEAHGHVSPDGRWLAYTSNVNGTWQVYVTTYPKAGRTWQISPGRGQYPRWRRDGRELYYRDSASDTLMAVAVGNPGFGRPQPLFPLPSAIYDAGPDGRFLIGKPQLNASSPRLTVLANWP